MNLFLGSVFPVQSASSRQAVWLAVLHHRPALWLFRRAASEDRRPKSTVLFEFLPNPNVVDRLAVIKLSFTHLSSSQLSSLITHVARSCTGAVPGLMPLDIKKGNWWQNGCEESELFKILLLCEQLDEVLVNTKTTWWLLNEVLGSKAFAKSAKEGVEGIGLQVAGRYNYCQQVLERSLTFGEKCFST